QCKTSTVTFVEPNYDPYMYINGNRIRSQFYRYVFDNVKFNYYPRTTGIFFLKDKYIVKLTCAPKDAYYIDNVRGSIGGYQKIQEIHLRFNDGIKKIEFDSLEQLYTYIESYTKHKRKDITHIQFELLNTFDKIANYESRYFSDSSNNDLFCRKLRNGEINQLNKDSFTYNKSRFNNKPHKADTNNARLDTSNRSIKRLNNVIKKTGALYKSGSSITLRVVGVTPSNQYMLAELR
ncbi:MAG: hypothetical protein NTU43_07330, partial [Bacteroidetes bacterium]|nr:hypothetical protein [Bacteroidota bacterium]